MPRSLSPHFAGNTFTMKDIVLLGDRHTGFMTLFLLNQNGLS